MDSIPIITRGTKRFAVNLVRMHREPEEAILDILADANEWLRHSLPIYKQSWSVKAKAHAAREYMRAAYLLIEEFFADCREQQINIPRSARTSKSVVERYIEGH